MSAKRKISRRSERKHQLTGNDFECEFYMSVKKAATSIYTSRTRNTLEKRFHFFFFSPEKSFNGGKIPSANLVRVGTPEKVFKNKMYVVERSIQIEWSFRAHFPFRGSH